MEQRKSLIYRFQIFIATFLYFQASKVTQVIHPMNYSITYEYEDVRTTYNFTLPEMKATDIVFTYNNTDGYIHATQVLYWK